MSAFKTRQIAAGGVAVVAALVLAACADTGGGGAKSTKSSGTASAAGCKQTTAVKLQEWPGDIINMVPYVAMAKGMFEKNCLDASFVPVNSGPGAVKAAITGDINFVNTAPNNVLSARANGVNIKVVANMYKYQPWALVVRDGMNLAHGSEYPELMQDLVGKKIGVTTLGGTAEAFARANFRSADLDPADATYLAIGATPQEVAALKARRADAIQMFGLGPDVAEAMGAGDVVVDLRKPDTGPTLLQATNGATLSWAATDRFIEKNSGTVDAFAKANDEAIAWIQDPANRKELYSIVEAKLKLPAGVPNPDKALRKSIDVNAKILSAGVPKEAIEGWNKFLAASDLLDDPIPYDDAVASSAAR